MNNPEALALCGLSVFERGWLSSNNILVTGNGPAALIDSGYFIHSAQTVSLVKNILKDQPLDLLLNTHLHSDHCGGNAALQSCYPGLKTLIPPGSANNVAQWDPVALTYTTTGQHCPRFQMDGKLEPGHHIRLGSFNWEPHAAKGHDPHSVVLFQPDHRVLISADALWENGFGVVFPELDGLDAFDEVADTLDLIEKLKPSILIPGHGPIFNDLKSALSKARSRLEKFVRHPEKHKRHAQKVLIKFKLLELQSIPYVELLNWASNTPLLINTLPSQERERELFDIWLKALLQELEKSNALVIQGNWIHNA